LKIVFTKQKKILAIHSKFLITFSRARDNLKACVCAYIFIYVCMCICMFMCMYVCVYVCILYINIHIYMCVCLCTFECIYKHTYTHICVYYLRMYVNVFEYMYVCMYEHMHTINIKSKCICRPKWAHGLADNWCLCKDCTLDVDNFKLNISFITRCLDY
jgi:hypothetical protein